MNTTAPVSFAALALACVFQPAIAQQPPPRFPWPDGKLAAVSLSFDDARPSQVEGGTALLDRYGVKATFYLVPSRAEQRLDGWKRAVANGHEIGNHSLTHPCSGNFPFARARALEDYSLERIRAELVDANAQLRALLGVLPESFAYPCGQTFVGRGTNTQSYVPIAASLFTTSRGWLDEAPNDPSYVDFAQITGMESDGKDFDDLRPLIENAKRTGAWVVLAGHETAAAGAQTTRLATLEALCAYALDPNNDVWIAPVGTVARYVQQVRARR
jgi:peptidoglycan/xylan/chitin deacetylase (PgdA/CDA1 family)